MTDLHHLYPELRGSSTNSNIFVRRRKKKSEKKKTTNSRSELRKGSLRLSSKSISSSLSEMKSVRKMFLCKSKHTSSTLSNTVSQETKVKPPFRPANPSALPRNDGIRLNENVPYDSAERYERELYEASKSKWLSPKGFIPSCKNGQRKIKDPKKNFKRTTRGGQGGVTMKIMKKIGQPPKVESL